MKKITKNWLKKHNACVEGIEWFLELENKSIENIFKIGLKQKKYNYLNWGICRLLNRKKKLKYAIYAAEKVLPIFEKKYPNDDYPRKAIEAAKKVLKKDNKENRIFSAAIVAEAVYADNIFNVVIHAAAFAAYAAISYAADVYTMNPVTYIINTIDREKLHQEILNYGFKLLKEKNKFLIKRNGLINGLKFH